MSGIFTNKIKKARCVMCKRVRLNVVLSAVLVSVSIFFVTTLFVYADPSSSAISGRLAATYNSKTGTVTAIIAGYCEGNPVIIGPAIWTVGEREFAGMKAEDVGITLCGKDLSLARVLKSSNNGKEIVSEVILVKQKMEEK
jgi:hypothetical protein